MSILSSLHLKPVHHLRHVHPIELGLVCPYGVGYHLRTS